MNIAEEFDLIVIGSGPGGQKAAIQGANAGLKVALVERERQVGGTCVHYGTIPSKTLREIALTIATLRRNADVFAFTLRDDMEVSTLMRRLDMDLNSYTDFVAEYVNSPEISYFHGRAALEDAHTVSLTTLKGSKSYLKTKYVVIATGSKPRTPPDIEVDHENILDSDSILSMVYLPRSLTVVGGGVIASEYASIFSLLGVKVTMFDRTPRPLMFMEPECTTKFLKDFTENGGEYIGETQYESIRWDSVSQVITRLDNGTEISSDKMLVAQGRIANTARLGLEDLGIKLGRNGTIPVDNNYQTSVENIYAVGDVIGHPSLASVSMEQGRRAICHALGVNPGSKFELVPIGIYSVPELSSVGLSEEAAREEYGDDIIIGRASFDEVARGQIAGIEDGLLKMIVHSKTLKILGVHIVAEGATDLIHAGEMAIINNNDVRVFLENVMNFPNFGEAYRIAALNIVTKRANALDRQPKSRVKNLIEQAELN
jgi:NAD(P) transhydrogenase